MLQLEFEFFILSIAFFIIFLLTEKIKTLNNQLLKIKNNEYMKNNNKIYSQVNVSFDLSELDNLDLNE